MINPLHVATKGWLDDTIGIALRGWIADAVSPPGVGLPEEVEALGDTPVLALSASDFSGPLVIAVPELDAVAVDVGVAPCVVSLMAAPTIRLDVETGQQVISSVGGGFMQISVGSVTFTVSAASDTEDA